MDIFEFKTGTFHPLPAEAIAELTEPQAKAYSNLVQAVASLKYADAEIEAAKAHQSDCMAALREAEQNAPPKRTFLQEWRAAKRI